MSKMNTIKNSDFKILVVDDEPDLLQITELVLRKEKYHIETALNGEDCMRAIRQDKPDLLLLDVMLPDINGIVLCEKIKNDPELSSIFIILISGSQIDSDNISEGLETGADGYLIKPVKNRELVARVEAAVRIIHTKKALRSDKKQLQKNMVKAIIHTEEKERAHFSKELHDGLGPLLSTIKLYLQWSERPNSKVPRQEIIAKAVEIIEEALTTVKEVSNRLSPHLLTNYGLNSAIKSFVEILNATASYNIVFESNTNKRIDLDIEVALYRIVIECINNTMKYAQANNIYIDLEDTGKQFKLHYRDDGKGFDISETLEQHKGLGLFNLKNRLQTFGGKVVLKSQPGKGVNYMFTVKI